MSKDSSPTIQGFKVRAVRVPMTEPHQTASGVITESPLVLTDILTDSGISGHSIVFTYTPAALKPTAELIQNFEALVQGDVLAPAEVEQKLAKRFRLLGPQGLVGIALAAIDMALWDALARVHSMPLVRLLGGWRSRLVPTVRSVTMACKTLGRAPRVGRSEDSQVSRPRLATPLCKRMSP